MDNCNQSEVLKISELKEILDNDNVTEYIKVISIANYLRLNTKETLGIIDRSLNIFRNYKLCDRSIVILKKGIKDNLKQVNT